MIGEIEEALESQGRSFNRRTLQRRLVRLEKAGRILIAGVGRATRYLPVVAAEKWTEANDGIFLSTESQEMQNRIADLYLPASRLVIIENLSIAISRMHPGTCRRQSVVT
jgi:hypothetical protein